MIIALLVRIVRCSDVFPVRLPLCAFWKKYNVIVKSNGERVRLLFPGMMNYFYLSRELICVHFAALLYHFMHNRLHLLQYQCPKICHSQFVENLSAFMWIIYSFMLATEMPSAIFVLNMGCQQCFPFPPQLRHWKLNLSVGHCTEMFHYSPQWNSLGSI